ncbi:transposase [Leptospira mayottensis]|uniref:transposase n=1 Tax=Leptospira mayottensis TaxID=1137606 RepID=UPI001EFFF6BF|nr:transposase [Leptospira mayottensis]
MSAGIESASPHESKLAEGAIIRKKVKGKIKDLVGDRAYDSDPLDEYLKKKYKVNLIAPHKSNRKKKKTQDGRKLRKYRGRWKIERTFSLATELQKICNSIRTKRSKLLWNSDTRMYHDRY